MVLESPPRLRLNLHLDPKPDLGKWVLYGIVFVPLFGHVTRLPSYELEGRGIYMYLPSLVLELIHKWLQGVCLSCFGSYRESRKRMEPEKGVSRKTTKSVDNQQSLSGDWFPIKKKTDQN